MVMKSTMTSEYALLEIKIFEIQMLPLQSSKKSASKIAFYTEYSTTVPQVLVVVIQIGGLSRCLGCAS